LRQNLYRGKNSPKWRQGTTKSSRGKKSKTSVLFLLFIVSIGILGFYLVQKGYFRDYITVSRSFSINNVVVEGTNFLDPEEIKATAGIKTGSNMFDVDLERTAVKLKETYVAKDFVVFKKFPDTIVIRIKERIPVALINSDSLVGVDSDGIILPHIGASFSSALPIITGISGDKKEGDCPAKERLSAGLKLMKGISEKAPSVYKKLSEVNVSSMSEMGVTLVGNGLEVIIGSDGLDTKIANIEKVLNEVTGKMDSVKAVDIRFGEKIFVRKATDLGDIK